MVEHHLAKVDVESSNLFARSIFKAPFRPGWGLFIFDLYRYQKRRGENSRLLLSSTERPQGAEMARLKGAAQRCGVAAGNLFARSIFKAP